MTRAYKLIIIILIKSVIIFTHLGTIGQFIRRKVTLKIIVCPRLLEERRSNTCIAAETIQSIYRIEPDLSLEHPYTYSWVYHIKRNNNVNPKLENLDLKLVNNFKINIKEI